MSTAKPLGGLCGAPLKGKRGGYCSKLPSDGRGFCRIHWVPGAENLNDAVKEHLLHTNKASLKGNNQ